MSDGSKHKKKSWAWPQIVMAADVIISALIVNYLVKALSAKAASDPEYLQRYKDFIEIGGSTVVFFSLVAGYSFWILITLYKFNQKQNAGEDLWGSVTWMIVASVLGISFLTYLLYLCIE